jgi:hypothetical protein
MLMKVKKKFHKREIESIYWGARKIIALQIVAVQLHLPEQAAGNLRGSS